MLRANLINIDELTILKQFFSSRINKDNCADFKTLFDVPDKGSPAQPGDTRLQTIWRQLPSNTNPEFAGMDAKARNAQISLSIPSNFLLSQINQVKGNIFSSKFPNVAGANGNFAYISEMALAVKLTNDPTVAALFQKTNIRVYEAMLGIDAVITAAGSKAGGIKPDWASSYKIWITKFLATQSTKVNNQIKEILNDNKKLGPEVQAKTKSIQQGVAALLKAYPTPAAFTLGADKLLSFPSTKTLNIKREASTKTPVASASATVPPLSTMAVPPTIAGQ